MLRIRRKIYGYFAESTVDISCTCVPLFNRYSIVSLLLLSTPTTSTTGSSLEGVSTDSPVHFTSYHLRAGPNFGEVMNPNVSGVKHSAERVIWLFGPFEFM